MFSNRFVTSIVVDGSVVQDRVDGQCTIPFGVEYGIKLTNKHSRRAQAEVFIDEISQGTFIVDAHSNWTLVRSQDKNRAFKFVKTQSSEAQHAKKSNLPEGVSGLIRIVWKLEKEKTLPQVPYVPYRPRPIKNPWDNPWKKPTYPSRPPTDHPYSSYLQPQVWCSSTDGGMASSYSMSSYSEGSSCGVVRAANYSAPKTEVGVTVDGGITSQNFITTAFEAEYNETVHLIKLVGFEGELPAPKLYCSSCGKKMDNKKWRHCPFCSNKL